MGRAPLARPPEQITLLDIYRASEAPPTIAIHHYPVDEACPISTHLKQSLAKLVEEYQSSFERSLAKTTLAELVADIRRRSK